jgi:hypothetical protein
MRLLSGLAHGVIDYASVILFAIGPTVSGFTGYAASVCYTLAVVHLLMTLITRFPAGAAKVLPFTLHGTVELIVGVLLIALPWLANFAAGVHSRNFFLFMGLVILLVWFITDYRGRGRAADTPTA